VVDVGAINSGGEMVWMRMRVCKGDGRVEGVWGTEEVVKDGVWIRGSWEGVVLEVAKDNIGEI